MKKGLGDVVEGTIRKVAPKFSKRKANCQRCARRKAILNRISGKK